MSELESQLQRVPSARRNLSRRADETSADGPIESGVPPRFLEQGSLLPLNHTQARSKAGQRRGRHDASRRVKAKSAAVEARARLSDCASPTGISLRFNRR